MHKANSKDLQLLFQANLSQIRIFNRAFEFAAFFCGDNCRNEWILGTTSGSNIVNTIKENIDKSEFDKFFNNAHERALIKYGIEFVLMPDLLVEYTEIIKEVFEFVKKCKDNNIKLAIISNWDPGSFKLMRAKLPEFFNLFHEDHIVIPHMLGKTKPALEIYDYTVKNLIQTS